MARDGTAIIFGPGQAFVDVTTNGWSAGTGTAPYGGTNIGYLAAGLVVDPGMVTSEQSEEGYGPAEVVEELFLGWDVQIYTTCIQFDATAMDLAFPELTRTSAGAQGRLYLPGEASGDGSKPPGSPLSGEARRFLYVPDNTADGKIVLLHNAIIKIDSGARIALTMDGAQILPLLIVPMRDTGLTGSDDAFPYRRLYWGPATGAVVGT